ncbi:MAG: BACON domain-containing protein, partial [Alistipes sp.]|nr:BACON domain-containing protein [Alistipes sp.]
MKKFFYFLLALPLVFAACENTEEPKPEVKDPVLNVTETTLDIVAEGAEGTIHYSVENAVEGTEVEATCAAEWVSDLTVAENITFVVEANEGEARETSIVVAYGDLQKSVAIKQAGAEAPVTVVGWGIVGTMNDWNATKPM